ncbi:MAG: tRNA (pseudouridine(54)-N(1))-methyltransferase TrmY [Nanopusillaceae archaeon]
MRIFIFYSNTVRTDGNFKNIYYSGRLDIVVNSIIHSFFISNGLRKDVRFDLLLMGKPVPPRLIRIESNIETPWSKKDIETLLSLSLKKFNRKGIKNPFPGIYVDKKDIFDLIDEYKKENRKIYLLDRNGENIENIKIENPVFIIGDFLGIPKDIKKKIENDVTKISLGDINYFSSQVIIILNYYLDKINYYKDHWDTSERFIYK